MLRRTISVSLLEKLKTDFRFARIGSHAVDAMRCARHARSSRKDGFSDTGSWESIVQLVRQLDRPFIGRRGVTPFNPDRKELRNITSQCEKLKQYDQDMYLVYALAYGLGLRSSEIQRAKFGDLHEDFDGNKLIRIHAPKSGGDFQDRPCDPAWWEEVLSFKTSDDGLIVPCQEDRITREFPGFLRRRCGITDDRPVHRLRKYCGHRVMRDNGNNAFIAQRALGHSSVEMTAKVYVGMPQLARSF